MWSSGRKDSMICLTLVTMAMAAIVTGVSSIELELEVSRCQSAPDMNIKQHQNPLANLEGHITVVGLFSANWKSCLKKAVR